MKKYKNIIKNLLNLVPIIKNDFTVIKNVSSTVFKIAVKDKVDITLFVIALILSALDLFTNIDLTGGMAFLTFFISSLIFRMSIWKDKYGQINKIIIKE